ncbi:hypothetical protein SAMN04490244_103354 [Tranquillimonas rosea]|uniref:Uncharacterized protein n=1 Tax=Tranquillimonas rosea TaxID=641238 RepID=A0A1H9SR91_9RHOB|nr:hypothetical protein [Tranquillimonas rosea]SER87520.1 hypothetical protein SAMN04490244_103354 [Tranquillimonas rosea]
MAKGKSRRGREEKKPKQEKAAPAPATDITKVFHPTNPKPGKKR